MICVSCFVWQVQHCCLKDMFLNSHFHDAIMHVLPVAVVRNVSFSSGLINENLTSDQWLNANNTRRHIINCMRPYSLGKKVFVCCLILITIMCFIGVYQNICIIICLLFCCIFIFRLKKLRKLSCSDRRFCKTCSSLLMPEDVDHSEHNIINSLTNNQLMTPTNLLPSLCDNKTNAVSFFALKAEVISKCIIFTMRRYASTVYAMALCPCLLSVTSRCSTKMAKHRLIVDLENFTTASCRCIGAINKPFDSQLVDCTYNGRVRHG